jgi:hypothetical protein
MSPASDTVLLAPCKPNMLAPSCAAYATCHVPTMLVSMAERGACPSGVLTAPAGVVTVIRSEALTSPSYVSCASARAST